MQPSARGSSDESNRRLWGCNSDENPLIEALTGSVRELLSPRRNVSSSLQIPLVENRDIFYNFRLLRLDRNFLCHG